MPERIRWVFSMDSVGAASVISQQYTHRPRVLLHFRFFAEQEDERAHDAGAADAEAESAEQTVDVVGTEQGAGNEQQNDSDNEQDNAFSARRHDQFSLNHNCG